MKPIEAFFFELNFDKINGLCVVLIVQANLNISRLLDTIRKRLDLHSAHYENTILIGDFNVSC